MKHIQFGWTIPSGPRTQERAPFLATINQGFDIIKGHFDSAWLTEVALHLLVKSPKATLRGRPRGRFGTDGSGKGLVRGHPLVRLGIVESVTDAFRVSFRFLCSSHSGGAFL